MKTKRHGWKFGKSSYLGIVSALTLLLFPAISGSVYGQQGNSAIHILDAQPVPVTHLGEPGATEVLGSGQARPLSLARGDFNQDGIEDLAVGYAAPDGSGLLVVYLGNIDAFAPKTHDAWLAIANNQFPSPFLSTAETVQLPNTPDFIAVGHFAGSDHLDILAAARGDNKLYLLAGNGEGHFAPPQSLILPGTITAMTGGRFGVGNLRSTAIVGIGGSQPGVLLYSASSQGWSLAGSYRLPAAPTAFVTDDMDGDGLPDVVMIAGQKLLILHAVGSSGRPELENLSLPLSPVSFVTGFFVHDRGWRRQIAVLDQAGAVNIVAHGGFDSRGWTKAEVKAMREALVQHWPNPFGRTEPGPAHDGWKIIETIVGMAPSGGSRHPLLLSSRLSGGGTDDVLVLDSGTAQMALANHPRVGSNANAFTPAGLATRVYAGGVPVAALLFPVNVDAREGLVVLHEGQATISVMMPVPGPRKVPAVQPAPTSSISGPRSSDIPVINSKNAHSEGQ